MTAKKDESQTEFDRAFAAITDLVGQYQAHRSVYRSASYTEAQLRQDFIDKLIGALGWDVHHTVQRNPFQQEVKVERSVRDGPAKRRADYAFYVAPNFRDVRLYIEAKKPYGDLATKDNYFQATRYGWNSQTPIAALTSFEEFHVIDCRYKPDIDAALEAGLRKYNCVDFLDKERFAELYYLFSREAVSRGSLEDYAQALPKRRGKAVQRGLFKGGYQRIDEAFLLELDSHRDALAKMLKNRNPNLDGDALTEITQRILDRLVFIRFLEDKLIEPEPLVASFGDRGTVWSDFVATSRRLDGVYNGIVFKKHPLIDTPHLAVDDGVFADICESLAHVNSPYDFNVIPIHILGSIYERFLGKVITTTEKRAKLEEKEEVRRAGGVFYTPEYVVRYVVANTIGDLIDGKTPGQIAKMHFVDIACGSGSFLLGAYDYLLRYHYEWYNRNPTKAKTACVLNEDGTYHLTLGTKRQILVNNIFGVDIDHQAVEVAQLSLFLKLLEEETPSSAREHQLEFHETLLPSLGRNVVSGNSLVSTDYEAGDLFGDEDAKRVNAMSFAVRFPSILQGGGFDAVIGNPPYIRMEEFKPLKEYFGANYQVHEERADIYAYMVERGLSLLRAGGALGMILSNKFMKAKYGQPLRRLFATDASVEKFVDLAGADVFHGATVRTVIVIVKKAIPQKAKGISYVPVPTRGDMVRLESAALSLDQIETLSGLNVGSDCFSEAGWRIIGAEAGELFSRITTNYAPLSDVLRLEPLFGLKTGLNEAFVVDADEYRALIASNKRNGDILRPILFGKDIRRYVIEGGRRWVIYCHPNIDVRHYPDVAEHLQPFKARLEKRATKQAWYELQQPAVSLLEINRRPKIVYPIIAKDCRFALDREGYLINDKAFVLPTDDLRVLGILNSRLAFFYFATVCAALEGSSERYLEFRAQYVRQFPFPKLPKLGRGDPLSALVTKSMEAREQFLAALTERDKEYYESQFVATERQIDATVYGLYGLSPTEIRELEEHTTDSGEMRENDLTERLKLSL